MKDFPVFVSLIVPFLLGCQAITPSSDSDFSKTPEKITRTIMLQSDEIVSMKRNDYDFLVKSSVDPELLASISSLRKQIQVAKEESQGSDISTFEIDTIPKDLILLRRQVPNQQSIVSLDSQREGYSLVVVQEKVDGDGRSEGYVGEVSLLFHKASHSFQLKDVMFRRYKGVPEWRLTDYLSDQRKKAEDLRRRL